MLLVLTGNDGLRIAASRLPKVEDAGALPQAVTPWLEEARRTRTASLRHGPEGARAADQRSCFVAPLIVRSKLLGFLYADVEGVVDHLDDADRELLAILAAQAAAALERRQSVQELEREIEERVRESSEAQERETATAEILKDVSSSPTDVQPVFDAIATSAQRLIAGASAIVTRVVGDSLHLAAFTRHDRSGETALSDRFRMPIAGSALEEVIAKWVAKIVRDTETDPRLTEQSRETARARSYRSWVGIPMLRRGAVIGTISVGRRDPGPFSNEEIAPLQTFADQAVIAIENVRLFNETKDALERQTATADVLQVISKSVSDAQPAFEKITLSCHRLFNGSQVGINLMRPDGLIDLAAYVGQGEAELRAMYPFPMDNESGTALVIRERHAFH